MVTANPAEQIDPLVLADAFWPTVHFYRQQQEIIRSVWENRITVVPAANEMGKDFVAAFIVLAFFLTRHPCRVVTTSAKDDHLRVLWGEIGQFLSTCRYPLMYDPKVGMTSGLIVNQREIKRVVEAKPEDVSYVTGMVASEDKLAAMQGHHATAAPGSMEEQLVLPLTLFVCDESSSVPDGYYKMADTWMHRALIFGNPWACDNFFKHAVKGNPETKDKGGDIPAIDGNGFDRKIIRIKAEESPNVRYALAEIKAGREPSHRILVPGVKSYATYLRNRRDWDAIQQCVCLDAEWYAGAEVLMYPPEWLNHAEQFAERIKTARRQAAAIGVDTGEGSAETVVAALDRFGLIELQARKTPDTSEIPGWVLGFMRKHFVPPEKVFFDRGGGGLEHADALRKKGYMVRTVAFGSTITPDKRPRGVVSPLKTRVAQDEERYAYKNRRAEMYHLLRLRLDPASGGFAIPARYTELRRQLAPVPLWYDEEGRIFLPPKQAKPGDEDKDKVTMTKLLGCSPDQSDALVLAVFGMAVKPTGMKLVSLV
jgi:hypothetical protein